MTRTTEEPSEHTARCESLCDLIPLGLAVYEVVDEGRDFVFVAFNRAAQALEHLDRGQVIGKSLCEVYPGIEAFGLLDVLRRVWKTGSPELLPAARYTDSRISGWREVHAFRLASGEVATVFHDASAAQGREESLRRSEDRYRRLVENLRQEYFFYSHDPEGVFTYVSPSITDVLGYSTREYLTGYDQHFTDDPVNVEARRYTERSIAGEQQAPYEVDCYHRHGGTRRLEVLEVPVFDDTGTVIAVEGIARDITAKRAMEQEMLKAQKLEALGVLAGGIAHDFNNLLTVILGNLTLHGEHRDGWTLTKTQWEDTCRAIDQARRLTQQLLTFSRGGLPVKQRVALSSVVREAVSLATSGSNIITKARLDALPEVEADPGQIQQVFGNLCINAVQAMPDGGALHIDGMATEVTEGSGLPLAAGPYARIRVRDEGVGIEEEHLGRLFDPYFTTKASGSGLGLTVCYSIVRNHGGHIAVESSPGSGATFTVYLPVGESRPTSRSVAQYRPRTASGRVLVMDDDEAIRRLSTWLLGQLGFEVVTVSEGGAAIEEYRNAREEDRPFDLVVLDLTVPGGLGGKDTIERLRAMDPAVRAIVASGYSNDPVMAEYRIYGFAGVLTKPYSLDSLRDAVHLVLGEDAAHEDSR